MPSDMPYLQAISEIDHSFAESNNVHNVHNDLSGVQYPAGGGPECGQDGSGRPTGQTVRLPLRQDLQPGRHGRVHRVRQVSPDQEDIRRCLQVKISHETRAESKM